MALPPKKIPRPLPKKNRVLRHRTRQRPRKGPRQWRVNLSAKKPSQTQKRRPRGTATLQPARIIMLTQHPRCRLQSYRPRAYAHAIAPLLPAQSQPNNQLVRMMGMATHMLRPPRPRTLIELTLTRPPLLVPNRRHTGHERLMRTMPTLHRRCLPILNLLSVNA